MDTAYEKTIGQIIGEEESINRFVIPNYQRGYRWGKKEVTKLLEDLYNAYLSNRDKGDKEKKKYCLQPVVVVKGKENADTLYVKDSASETEEYNVNEWIVVDGQQRLTTLYLLLLIGQKMNHRRQIYQIRFDSRANTTKILSIWEERMYDKQRDYEPIMTLTEYAREERSDANVGEDANRVDYEEKVGLDYYYLRDAVVTIKEWFWGANNRTKKEDFADFARYILRNTIMLWYESDKREEEDQVKLFCRINTGKIPLTVSELIKAYILKLDKEKIEEKIRGYIDNNRNLDKYDLEKIVREEFVKEQRTNGEIWDAIESKLSDDAFFGFINSGEAQYESRMDFLFQIVYLILKHENDQQDIQLDPQKALIQDIMDSNKAMLPSDEEVFEFFERKILEDHGAGIVWEKINDCYKLFEEWYRNSVTFHKIGLIVLCKMKSARVLKDLYLLHRNNKAGKKSFQEKTLDLVLKDIIRQELTKKVDGVEKVLSIDDLVYCDEDKEEKHKDEIRLILLLFNVLSAMRSPDYRFSFERVQPIKNVSIEHIFPQTPDLGTLTKEGRVAEIVSELKRECKAIGKGENIEISFGNSADEFENWWNNELLGLFGYDDKSIIQHIGNLAIVSKNINSSLSNKMFSGKQETIRQCDKNGEYIPLCTHNVFLKYYSIVNEKKDSVKADCHNRIHTLDIWTPNDIQKHRDSIYEEIKSFLPEEDITTETSYEKSRINS